MLRGGVARYGNVEVKLRSDVFDAGDDRVQARYESVAANSKSLTARCRRLRWRALDSPTLHGVCVAGHVRTNAGLCSTWCLTRRGVRAADETGAGS